MAAAGAHRVARVYEPVTSGFHREDDMLAAEYVLGLLQGEDIASASRRAAEDRNFAARVANWQERFAAMAEEIAPVTPSRRQKRALLATVFPEEQRSVMRRLRLWQGVSFAALALAGFLGFALLQLQDGALVEPSGSVHVATLTGEGNDLRLLAVVDDARQHLSVRQVAGAAPPGRVLELWAILPDQAPVSMGLVGSEATTVALPAEMALQLPQITFAVSEEPPGGAPEGQPTGQVLATGTVSTL